MEMLKTCPPVKSGYVKNVGSCGNPGSNDTRIWTQKVGLTDGKNMLDGNYACKDYYGGEFECSNADTKSITSNCDKALVSSLVGGCRRIQVDTNIYSPKYRWLCRRKAADKGGCGADPIACCLDNKDAQGGKSCPVEYKAFGSPCAGLLTEYCNTPDRLQSDTNCLKWQSAQPNQFNLHARGICAKPENSSNVYCSTYYPAVIMQIPTPPVPTQTPSQVPMQTPTQTPSQVPMQTPTQTPDSTQVTTQINTDTSNLANDSSQTITIYNIFLFFILIIFAVLFGVGVFALVKMGKVSDVKETEVEESTTTL